MKQQLEVIFIITLTKEQGQENVKYVTNILLQGSFDQYQRVFLPL